MSQQNMAQFELVHVYCKPLLHVYISLLLPVIVICVWCHLSPECSPILEACHMTDHQPSPKNSLQF